MTDSTTPSLSPSNSLEARPSAPLQHDPTQARESIAGPDAGPVKPFPVYLEGHVTRGFGRGSKELGCPTGELALGPGRD